MPSIGALFQAYWEVSHAGEIRHVFLCLGLWLPEFFLNKEVIFSNAYAFVITRRKRQLDDTQGCAHIFEDALEPNDGVNNDNRNHAKQENNIHHEIFHKLFRMCLYSDSRDEKLR